MSEKKATSRRDFLQGRVSIDARPAAESDDEKLAKPFHQSQSLTRANYLQHFSKRAMACEFELFFNLNQYDQSGNAAGAAFELIDRLESQLSVYREDSEVSLMNRTASDAPFTPSPVVCDLLARSIELHKTTAGAFDVTSMPLSDAWGFSRREAKVPSEEEIVAALRLVNTDHISFVDDEVRFGVAGLSVNFNSIGKGYAVDRAVETIQAEWVNDFVIHGGQSSVAARGSEWTVDDSTSAERPASPAAVAENVEAKIEPESDSVERVEEVPNDESGWKVGLSHPFVSNHQIAEFTLRDQSLSTSGTARQGFFHKGRRYGHVLDPRTGWPTDHFLSTTVICESTALSDALATAFFVMSLKEVEMFCDQHPEVAAVLVVPKSKSGGVTIETFNLPAGMMRLEES